MRSIPGCILLIFSSVLLLATLLWVQGIVKEERLNILQTFTSAAQGNRKEAGNAPDWRVDGQYLMQMREIRDQLSRRLNTQTEKLFQLQCQMGNDTSETGGWCSRAVETNHMHDTPVAQALSKLFADQSVASFGDGPGKYRELLLQYGEVKSYTAFDGAPFIASTTGGNVQFMDLTLPQYGLPAYDWVLSLEVAEHIPRKYEMQFIDNIVRHAKIGIVLSWAVPDQGGFHHVNGREFKWVTEQMAQRCFSHDSETSESLKATATFPWLKQNTNVFKRNSSCPIDLLMA